MSTLNTEAFLSGLANVSGHILRDLMVFALVLAFAVSTLPTLGMLTRGSDASAAKPLVEGPVDCTGSPPPSKKVLPMADDSNKNREAEIRLLELEALWFVPEVLPSSTREDRNPVLRL